jgi:FtsH-binding integral membrane protein
MRTPTSSRHAWWALVADLVCVVAFAAGGKSAHDDSATWCVIARIAWPYAVACLLGWALVLRRGWDPRRWRPAGIAVLASTYLLGMVLRVVSGRGIALGFLIVAIVFLTLTMLGWRLVAAWVGGRPRARTTPTR